MTVHNWRQLHREYPGLIYCQEFDPRMLEEDGLSLELAKDKGGIDKIHYDQAYVKEKLKHDFFDRLTSDEQFSTFLSILDAVVEEAYARTENG